MWHTLYLKRDIKLMNCTKNDRKQNINAKCFLLLIRGVIPGLKEDVWLTWHEIWFICTTNNCIQFFLGKTYEFAKRIFDPKM